MRPNEDVVGESGDQTEDAEMRDITQSDYLAMSGVTR